MPIRFECAGCHKKLQVAATAAGKSIRCPSCRTVTRAPATQEPDDDAVFVDLPEDERAGDGLQEQQGASIFESGPSPSAARRHPAGGGAARASRKSAKSGSSSVGKWILIVAGSGVALLLLCCGGGYFVVTAMLKPPQASPQASEPFPVESISAPAFPELGQPQAIEQSEVQIFNLDLAAANAGKTQPASRMQLRVYLPPGEHPAGSLGCVLIAPAGTTLLTGNALDDPTYHTEALPYARAGYAALTYSLDGAPAAGSGASIDDESARAYRDFSAAFAGLANARAALEFVLARLPQVNPRRIFAAGHSSAGTLALLFAAHEPRLAGCIAYAPQADVEAHLGPLLRLMVMTEKFPGIVDFARRSSPQTHVARIRCPVFLFAADDDAVVTPEGIQRFATTLGQFRQDVTVRTVPSGGHFESMVNPGMGLAIEWLQKLPGEQATVGAKDIDGNVP